MADRFEDLRTLLAVISSGGVNAAAAELGIAKSAVSRRLSDLEKRLGVTLIDRTNRRLDLTAVGTEYARRARAVMDSLEELDGSVVPAERRAAITVRAPAALLTHAIVPALAMVRHTLSPGSVQLTLAATGSEPSAGADDVVVGLDAPSSYQGRDLFTTTLVMCASPNHFVGRGAPREAKDLDDHPAITLGDPAAGWLLRGRDRAFAEVSVVSSDVDAAAAAAVAGMGLAQLPDYVVAAALSDGRLVQVLAGHEPAAERVRASHPPDAGANARRLVDALAEAFERRPLGGGKAVTRVGD